MNMKELADAFKVAGQWAQWDSEIIDAFHEYAHRHDCSPGRNVYEFVLQDANKFRELSAEQCNRSTARHAYMLDLSGLNREERNAIETIVVGLLKAHMLVAQRDAMVEK